MKVNTKIAYQICLTALFMSGADNAYTAVISYEVNGVIGTNYSYTIPGVAPGTILYPGDQIISTFTTPNGYIWTYNSTTPVLFSAVYTDTYTETVFLTTSQLYLDNVLVATTLPQSGYNIGTVTTATSPQDGPIGFQFNKVVFNFTLAVIDRHASIKLTSLGQFATVDIAYGPVASVPIPGTIALMSLGLAGLGYRRRKSV